MYVDHSVCVCVCGITYLESMVTRATVRSNAVLPLHLRKQGTLHVHVVKEVVYHPDKQPCLLSLLVIHSRRQR